MAFPRILGFWNNFRAKQKQEDLFEYTQRKQKKEKGRKPQAIKNQKATLWLVIGLILLSFSFAGGYMWGKKQKSYYIGRQAVIYPFEGLRERGYWESLTDGRLQMSRDKSDPRYNPFEKEYFIQLDNVRRIDLFPDKKNEDKEEDKEKESLRKLSQAEQRFLGRYRIQISQHRGLFYIYRSHKKGLRVSIRFTNWGNQVMEFLHSTRVRGRNIYFRRSCKGLRCTKIGATRSLNQKFQGTISKNGKKITGTYSGGQSGSRWSAVRY